MTDRGAALQVALADTNIFVALLVGPPHALHEAALALFRRVAEGGLALQLTPVVVAELVYACLSVLRWDRDVVAGHLTKLLTADGVHVREGDVLIAALQLFRSRPAMDFPNAYLAASALVDGPPIVASFDRDYDAITGLQRIAG